MTDHLPPLIINRWHCPGCHRFETFEFKKHYSRGKVCPGVPVHSVYVLQSSIPSEVQPVCAMCGLKKSWHTGTAKPRHPFMEA